MVDISGNNLRSIRQGAGLSQAELGYAARVASTIISSIELGKLYPYPAWRQRLSDALNVPEGEIFPIEYLRQINKAASAVESLYAMVNTKPDAKEQFEKVEPMRVEIDRALNLLDPKERDILRARFGLDDGRMKTLQEVGEGYGVTGERIRQIEARALRKLRRQRYLRALI